MENSEIMNSDEAAELLRVSKSWISKAVSRRTIPYYKPNKKTLYFKRTELLEYAFSNRIATREEDLAKYNTKQYFKKRG